VTALRSDWTVRYDALLSAAGITASEPLPYDTACRMALALAAWCPARHFAQALELVETGRPPHFRRQPAGRTIQREGEQ
jgi:hypothetical protein